MKNGRKPLAMVQPCTHDGGTASGSATPARTRHNIEQIVRLGSYSREFARDVRDAAARVGRQVYVFAEFDLGVVAQIARCVISSATFEENVEWARDLSIPDRRKMDDAIMSSMEGVGPQLGEVDTRCSECKAPVSYTMDWVSLLLS